MFGPCEQGQQSYLFRYLSGRSERQRLRPLAATDPRLMASFPPVSAVGLDYLSALQRVAHRMLAVGLVNREHGGR
jgi:hypothetical protein